MLCPNCGKALPNGAEYCTDCGYLITSETVDPTVVAPQRAAQYEPIQAPVIGRTPSEHDSARHNRRGRGCLAFMLTVFLLAAVAAGAYWSWTQELWGGVSVPKVMGLAEEDARFLIENAGFYVEKEERAADDQIGAVLFTNPLEGTRIKKGSTVTITVAVPRTIPEVNGMAFDKAKQALIDAGAKDIAIDYSSSNQEEGTVVSVDPPSGSSFISSDKITLTIAQAYTIPDLVGKNVDEAISALESAGLGHRIIRVSSDKESNTVVEMAPSAGTKIKQGDIVELSVASPNPSDIRNLEEYFTMTPEEIALYLSDQNAVLEEGYAQGTYAYARYGLASGDTLTFTQDPETAHYYNDGPSSDVLAEGYKPYAIRYTFANKQLTDKYDLAGVAEIQKLCGFTGDVKEYVTETTLEPPSYMEGLPTDDKKFICAYGEQGNYIWVVLIQKDANPIAALAPKEHYDELLREADGNIASIFAFIDIYTG